MKKTLMLTKKEKENLTYILDSLEQTNGDNYSMMINKDGIYFLDCRRYDCFVSCNCASAIL